MRVLYLCSDLGIPVFGRKGAACHVRAFAEALQRAGHPIVLCAARLTRSPWEAPVEASVPTIELAPDGAHVEASFVALTDFETRLGLESSLPGELRRVLYNEELAVRLRRRLERNPPELIFERASLYGTAGVAVARALEVPLVAELNAPLALEQATYRGDGLQRLAAAAERFTLRSADAVLVVSTALRAYAVSLGVSPERVHVLPNGVDPTLFHSRAGEPALRLDQSLNGGPVLGFVGGLRPWHGVEVLPALLERLLGTHPSLRLVIVGEGPLAATIRDELAGRGVERNAILTGWRPQAEVARLIDRFDVALAPYPELDHGFYFSPLKLFEYMACGTAVIAANAGQIAEIIEHGESGLLYSPGDIDELVSCCELLLEDDGLRRRLGETAAARVRAHHTWEQNARRVTEIARPLLRRPA